MNKSMQTIYEISKRHPLNSTRFYLGASNNNALVIEFEDIYMRKRLARMVSQLDTDFIPDILLMMEEEMYGRRET